MSMPQSTNAQPPAKGERHACFLAKAGMSLPFSGATRLFTDQQACTSNLQRPAARSGEDPLLHAAGS